MTIPAPEGSPGEPLPPIFRRIPVYQVHEPGDPGYEDIDVERADEARFCAYLYYDVGAGSDMVYVDFVDRGQEDEYLNTWANRERYSLPEGTDEGVSAANPASEGLLATVQILKQMLTDGLERESKTGNALISPSSFEAMTEHGREVKWIRMAIADPQINPDIMTNMLLPSSLVQRFVAEVQMRDAVDTFDANDLHRQLFGSPDSE